MEDIRSLLLCNYPTTSERIEGKLVYLDSYGINSLHFPSLSGVMNLQFFKAKFFTGYRKFTKVDVIVGVAGKQTYLLLNPVFSNGYSSLVEHLEQIDSNYINGNVLGEIVTMYKETGVDITPIGRGNKTYQIWFGKAKWRMLRFETHKTLKIIMIPNYRFYIVWPSWVMKLFMFGKTN